MSKRVILWSTPEQVAKEAAEVKAGNGLLLLGDIDGSLVEVIIPATHSMDDVKARGEAAEAARAATAGARITPDMVTDEMVSRFLAWKLPQDFGPDNGISFNLGHATPSSPWWPTGTNLLNAQQARAMLQHVLGEEA